MIGSAEDPGRADQTRGPDRLTLSLVIPAYNESQRLEAGLGRLREAVDNGSIDPSSTEFVLVDDGSTDDTGARAESLLEPYPHVQVVRLETNHGKGAAVRAGVTVATAPMIAFADADMSIDPSQTPEFMRALAEADVAIGSRAAVGASVDVPSLRRSVMNRSFNGLVNMLTRVSLSDTQCGFKAFRAPAAKLLFHCSVTERFAFDVEILSLARRLGLPIAQVPVHWTRVKGSRVRPWLDPGAMTREVVRLRRRSTSVPAVPALDLALTASGAPAGAEPSVALKGLLHELSPVTPVLLGADGHVTVLCPLMSETQIEKTAERMTAHFPEVALQRSMLSVAELATRAPLTLSWDL